MGTALEKEMETFEAKKKELLARAEGMFALVKGEIVVGVFESQGDALREGYKLFGKEAFLVKQILAVEPSLPFASPLIGAQQCLPSRFVLRISPERAPSFKWRVVYRGVTS